ncbi:MAG: YARHG domain-containing protein [Flavobacteriales bacterium]
MKTLIIVLVVVAGISAFALYPSPEVMPSKLNEMQAFRDSVSKVIEPELPSEVTKNLVIYSQEDLIGDWVGWVESLDSIKTEYMEDEYYHPWYFTNLHIDKFNDDKVVGYLVVNGLKKEIGGTVKYNEGVYSMNLNTPGDLRYSCSATISEMDSVLSIINVHLSGANDFEMEKRLFAYDPESSVNDIDWPFIDDSNKKIIRDFYVDENGDTTVYELDSYFTNTDAAYKYNTSKELLTESDVENMKKGDILVLRNSIFARHGYIFKDQKFMNYFGYAPWYVPCQTEVAHELTDLELKNIDLLLRYEEHAEEYYDVFGR